MTTAPDLIMSISPESIMSISPSNESSTDVEEKAKSLDSKIHLWINLIGLPVVMVMSAVGNTLSFIVMTHRTMRQQTTSW